MIIAEAAVVSCHYHDYEQIVANYLAWACKTTNFVTFTWNEHVNPKKSGDAIENPEISSSPGGGGGVTAQGGDGVQNP